MFPKSSSVRTVEYFPFYFNFVDFLLIPSSLFLCLAAASRRMCDAFVDLFSRLHGEAAQFLWAGIHTNSRYIIFCRPPPCVLLLEEWTGLLSQELWGAFGNSLGKGNSLGGLSCFEWHSRACGEWTDLWVLRTWFRKSQRTGKVFQCQTFGWKLLYRLFHERAINDY